MKSQRFGIEIEMTGITRSKAARLIAGYFGTTATHVGGDYDTYTVRMGDGRQWKIVRDASIYCEANRAHTEDYNYSVELVSPICKYEDIVTVQEIVRKLRTGGAVVNDSCGIHVHIDASKHDERTLRNIVNIMAAKEEILFKALNVAEDREEDYCKKMDEEFLSEINRKRPKNMVELEEMWYKGDTDRYRHYHDSRYHALNLHSVFTKGTVEFRLFNSTLHAGEVKTYIQLCMAISHQALVQRGASHLRTNSNNEKYTFRTWLLRLGMIGDEFKTARGHLLKKLDGNVAWKDPSQAIAQRERLAAQRALEEQENSVQETQDNDAEQEESLALNLTV